MSSTIYRKLVALALAVALPASASAAPLAASAAHAGRELGMAQAESGARGRGRLWTSIALIVGGGALAVLGGIELGDSDGGANEGNDADDGPGMDDANAAEKLMLGGGIAAAGLGALLLMTGRRSCPAIKARPGRVAISHSVRV